MASGIGTIKNLTRLVLFTLLFSLLMSTTAQVYAQTQSTTTPTTANTTANSENCPSQKCPETPKGAGQVRSAEALGKEGLVAVVYDLLIGIGGFFVWLGGLALDTSIKLLVVGMGEFVRDTMIVAINELWTIIRDLFNILFIFGLIYIGFKTILGTDETGTRRMLVTLIAAALLINFSLLFTKTIVDFSNATAYQVYKLIEGADATYQASQDGEASRGIAASFMQEADLTSYANATSDDKIANMSDSNFIMYGFFVMILMLIAAFVFLAGAFMLIARFVILVVSMILSPAMFLGMIFPQFNNLSSMWWSKFLGNAFMAPAYIFMLFLSLKTIQTINRDGTIFEAFQGDSWYNSSFGVIIIFFVMAGFLYMSLVVAQQMGGQGASYAMKAAHAVRGKVQSYAARGGGRFAQKTAGWAASKAGSYLDRKSAANENHRGYLGRRSRAVLSSIENAKFGAQTSRKDRKEEVDQEKTRHARAHAVHGIQSAVEAGSKSNATREEKAAAEKALSQATNPQIQEIAKTKEGRKLLTGQAGKLTASQVSDLMKSETLDDSFKKELGEQVSKQTLDKMKTTDSQGNPTIDPAKLTKASKAEIKAIGATELSKPSVAVHLTADQIKHVESEMTESEAEVVKAARKTELINAAKGNSNHKSKEELLGMNPSELPKEALIELAPNLPVGTIRKIAADNKTDPKTAKAIRDRIVPGLKEPPKNPATGDYIKPGQPGYKNEYDMWRFLNIEDRGRSFGRTENSPSDSDKDTDQYELPL